MPQIRVSHTFASFLNCYLLEHHELPFKCHSIPLNLQQLLKNFIINVTSSTISSATLVNDLVCSHSQPLLRDNPCLQTFLQLLPQCVQITYKFSQSIQLKVLNYLEVSILAQIILVSNHHASGYIQIFNNF